MSLPTAVATGAAAESSLAVRPGRAGLVAGVLAAMLVFAVYVVAPVPDRIARLFGAETSELAKRGGMRMTWVPPAGVAPDRLAKIAADARREGDAFVIDVPAVDEADIPAVAEQLVGGGELTFHRVVRLREMAALVQLLGLTPGEPGLLGGADVETWRAEGDGEVRMDYFLVAPLAEELDAMLARVPATGWKPPEGVRFARECVASHQSYRGSEVIIHAGYCRTYTVSEVAELAGDDIASAVNAYDPNTNRPTILLDFTPDGAQKLARLTEAIAGEKLAAVVGDTVISAPVINGPIRGGRASITMGGADPTRQDRDARVLASVLRGRALPAGGTLRAAIYLPPTGSTMIGRLALGVLAAVAGLLVGLVAWAVVRRSRPVRRPLAAVAPGGVPWARIGVTLLAPLSAVGLPFVPALGLDGVDLPDEAGLTESAANLGSLGIIPVITAYVLVEIVAAIIPGWRRRRHAGEGARRPFTNLVPAVALMLGALQARWIVHYFELALNDPSVSMMGSVSVVPLVGSLLGGVLVFVVVAEVIRRWGLGNGYGALIASWWSIDLVRTQRDLGGEPILLPMLVASFAILLVGVAIASWRIARVGELALHLPTSGAAPLAQAAGLIVMFGLLATLDAAPVRRVEEWTFQLLSRPTLLLALVAITAVAWSGAFAWGRRLERVAGRIGLAGPSRAAWVDATLLTAAVLVALAVVARGAADAAEHAGVAAALNVIEGLVTAAVLVDIVHDLRGRRVPRVRVWSLHQPHLADAVERALIDADIPCHLSGAHLRAMLSFFGPFAPIDVYVRPEDATRAHAKLSELLPVE